MLQSKKARMTLSAAGIIPLVVALLGVLLPALGVPEDVAPSIQTTVAYILGAIFAAYNLGQGMADFGKEAAKEGASVEVIELEPIHELREYNPRQ